jgi:hypothetical protein
MKLFEKLTFAQIMILVGWLVVLILGAALIIAGSAEAAVGMVGSMSLLTVLYFLFVYDGG